MDSAVAEEVDRVIATVNGAVITQNQLNRRISEVTDYVTQLSQGRVPPKDTVRRQALDMLVDEALLLEKAEGTFREDSAERMAQREFDEYVKRLQEEIGEKQFQARLAEDNQTLAEFRSFYTADRKRRILVEQSRRSWIDEFLLSPIPKNQLEKYLEDHPQLKEKLQIHLVLIRVPPNATGDQEAALRRKAERVLNLARAGEPFEDLVKKYSQDTRPEKKGGLYELESPTVPFPEFAPVFDLAVGRIYPELVRIPAGWCIIRVHSREGLTNLARRAMAEEEFRKGLKKLRDEATIVVDPSLFANVAQPSTGALDR